MFRFTFSSMEEIMAARNGWLTVMEASKYFGVSRRTIYDWIKSEGSYCWAIQTEKLIGLKPRQLIHTSYFVEKYGKPRVK